MDGYQGFLQEVLHVSWTVLNVRESAFVVTTQMTAQFLQKLPVCSCVAPEPADMGTRSSDSLGCAA